MTKGSAPNLSINVSAATNRITGGAYAYDANGNMTVVSGQPGTFVYDVENRITCTYLGNCANYEQYGDGPDNKRVWKRRGNGTEEVYFYGVGGQRLGVYVASVHPQGGFSLALGTTDVYFGSKKIRTNGVTVAPDRLGSVRSSFGGAGATRYFPYGEELGATGNERDKFGTYYRDASGLDYADQRFYASSLGSFLTPDPYEASGGPAEPAS